MHEIYRVGGMLDLAVTLPDDHAQRKSGRVYLDSFCESRQIPLVKSPHVNDRLVIEAVRRFEIDWLFIIGWSQIANPDLLSAPNKGVLGMHPTLLPVGRGRASIPWAILKGLGQTGVTLFKLDQGVDTGPVLDQEILDLSTIETATTLYDRMIQAHRALIARVWRNLLDDRVILQQQDEALATVWPGRSPEDGRIDASRMTVDEIDRLVRAVTKPYPGAFLNDRERRLRIWAGIRNRPDGSVPGWLPIQASDGVFYATEFEHE